HFKGFSLRQPVDFPGALAGAEITGRSLWPASSTVRPVKG
ncbi:ATP6V0D1 isoform 12, partial [Pan troglodytes]